MKLLLKFLFVLLPTLSIAQQWQMKQASLMTSFSKDVDPANVLPEYPRPQLVRKDWMNLNGVWQFQPGTGATESVPQGNLSRVILVPFAVESAISGVKEHHARLWYRRKFTVPATWNSQHVILNFGAVDYESEIYINGTSIGVHRGGYDPFSFDITKYLKASGEQEITVRVFDPTDAEGNPRGKQTLYPGGIMYTAVTGIWQSVWLEPVQETHIKNIKIIPDIDQSVLKLTVNTDGNSTGISVSVLVKPGAEIVQTSAGSPNLEIRIPIPNQKLWSPDSPFLYDLEIKLIKNGLAIDSVGSYFGMRKIAATNEGGIKKLYLNNKFLFQMGPLDQGFWPDGLYTAPTDKALRYDIEMMKAFGFNMVRKHIKVEPFRWYYWADKLGLMVWQDMPSANSYTDNPQSISQVAYENELTRMVEEHWNSPSIVMWVIFNEAQGQHRTPELVQKVMTMDPTRMVNQASGGNFFDVGHILDIHSYPAPASPKSTEQVLACGEYGGIGYKIPGHLWNNGFGYIMANNEAEYLSLYEQYADQLTMFKTNQGLSAAVYTEITDVEIEINGLMTYDRLVKADVGRINQANTKVIKHDIYLNEVVPSSEKTEQIWKYTTSTPSSDWYSGSYDDLKWSLGKAGFGTMGTPGAVIRTIWNSSNIWIRRSFGLGDLSGINLNNLVLNIHHDEDCEVYINGVLAASATGWSTGYVILPINEYGQKALKSNSMNTIAIHCKQTGGGQYIDAGISQLNYDESAPAIPNYTSATMPDIELNNFLYPGLADDSVQFKIPFSNPVELRIINTKGSEVKKISGIVQKIDVSGLPSGVYLITVTDKSEIQSFRFIKK